MPPSKFYSSIAACILSLSPLVQAIDKKPSVPPSAASQKSCANASSKENSKLKPNLSAKESIDMNSPLLQKEFYPLWTQMEVSQAPALMQKLIKDAELKSEEFSQLKAEEMSYQNTFGMLESLEDEIMYCYMSVINLNSIADSPELRKVIAEMSAMATAFSSTLINNEALWKNIQIAAKKDWVAELSPAKKRDIESTLNSFRDGGAKLNIEQKKRRQAILEELSKLQLKFAQNIKDSSDAWSLIIKEPAQLAGMSPEWMAIAAQKALSKGHGSKDAPQWMITLDYPSYGVVLKHCDHVATRKACWIASSQVAQLEPYRNEPLVHRIAQLRQELAELLGFKNFASLQTKERMIESEPNMRRFIEGMIAQSKPAFDKESADFLAFISAKKGKKVKQVHPWERHYYQSLLSDERNQFDAEELRAYFPHEKVTQGMFRIFEQLLDIRFKEKASYCPAKGEPMTAGKAEVWNPEVKIFDVFDASSNKHMGSFYLDLFYRDKKRAGAWMMTIRRGDSGLMDKPYRPQLAALVCNFTRPIDGKQALLSHREVVILFHELGHTLHLMLSETELRSQSGTAVAKDFVEFPSQLAEYWTWDPQSLDTIASQHETGAKIPDEIKKKLQQSQHFLPAMANMGQLSLALMDLELHSQYDKLLKGKKLNDAEGIILKDMLLPFSTKIPSNLHRLSHCISGGYASGYYSYKWAEVLAADGFSRFRKDGVLNANTGKLLRESVLSKGNSAPATELFKNFMGREPNADALLEQQGILPSKAKK